MCVDCLLVLVWDELEKIANPRNSLGRVVIAAQQLGEWKNIENLQHEKLTKMKIDKLKFSNLIISVYMHIYTILPHLYFQKGWIILPICCKHKRTQNNIKLIYVSGILEWVLLILLMNVVATRGKWSNVFTLW